jgi:hypothetical protein
VDAGAREDMLTCNTKQREEEEEKRRAQNSVFWRKKHSKKKHKTVQRAIHIQYGDVLLMNGSRGLSDFLSFLLFNLQVCAYVCLCRSFVFLFVQSSILSFLVSFYLFEWIRCLTKPETRSSKRKSNSGFSQTFNNSTPERVPFHDSPFPSHPIIPTLFSALTGGLEL